MKLIAHINKSTENKYSIQLLEDHLMGTSMFAAQFATAFHNPNWGKLIGLWHDLGKYSFCKPNMQSL